MGRDHDYGAERDARLLRLVAVLRFVRAEHVTQVLFGGRTRVANRRLLALTAQGRLRRVRPITQGPYVYCLPGTRVTRSVYEALDMADLYAALIVTRPPGHMISRYDPQWESGPVRADALVVLGDGKRSWVTFVEWDSGTVSIPKVAAKADSYHRLGLSGAHEQAEWWQPGTPVSVLIATTAHRVAPLQRAIAARGRPVPIRVTSHETVLRSPWRHMTDDKTPRP